MTQLIGHDAQANALISAAKSGKLHHAWLLTGPKGLGKASFARMAGARLLADAAGATSSSHHLSIAEDHATAKLIAAGSHPDFILLERLINDKKGDRARNINIEQVRQVIAKFATTPSQADRRVVIVDAADDLERNAANALLKSLEEPPASTSFLLVSHFPGRLLPTIRSRCTMLRFSRLSDNDMALVLRRELPDADPIELQALVSAGAGSPGKALQYAGLDLSGIDAILSALVDHGDPDNAQRIKLSKSLSLKSAQARYEALLARTPGFIAEVARGLSGDALSNALKQWEAARSLAQSAVHLSLDQQSTVFALAGHVAALATRPGVKVSS